MKNKELIILFLAFLIIIYPLEEVLAFGWNDIKNKWNEFTNWIGNFGRKVADSIKGLGDCLNNFVFCGTSLFIYAITWVIHHFLWTINLGLLAPITDLVSKLNPFEGINNPKIASKLPVVVIWDILKNFAYIFLVFSALAAGYEWLLGDDASAKRLIFNIIVVALIISFTFVLVAESFLVIKKIEDGIIGDVIGNVKEKGIGNVKKEGIGTFFVSSLWQQNPFDIIRDITKVIDDQNSGFRYLFEAMGYVFIIVFDMITFIILLFLIFLFIARYIIMIFLAGTSSVAVATLTFPEFKGALGQIMSGFRVFDTWLDYFVRWLLVVTIFVFLIILGNILKENTLEQLSNLGLPVSTSTTSYVPPENNFAQIISINILNAATSSPNANPNQNNKGVDPLLKLVQFVVLFLLLISWYLISIIIANRISRSLGTLAKGIATAILLALGGVAGKLLLTATQGTIGGVLSNIGKKIEEGVGVGGRFGWRSWVGQKIGRPIKETGEEMIKKRYGLETEAIKTRISNIDEQLRKTTDPGQIQKLTSQLYQLVQQYKGNDYVLKSINESIKRMSPYSASKILASDENLRALGSSDVPQETREAVIGLVDKLRKGDLKKMAGEARWMSTLREISPDVTHTFIEKISKEFKETDVLDIISKDEIRGFISKLEKDDNLRKTLNNVSKGFINALLERNIEQISNAMASWDKDIWTPENTEKINNVLKSQLSEDEIKASILETIRKTENRSAMIRGALREAAGGPLRTILGRLTDKERDELKKLLTPQDQATLEAIRGVIIP
jgi:hypothetical protein